MSRRVVPLVSALLLASASVLAAAAAPKDIPAAPRPPAVEQAVAALQARLDALLPQGTDLKFRDQYEALLAEAIQAAERFRADPASAGFHLIIARCCEAMGENLQKDVAFARYVDALMVQDKARAAAELRREADALIARRQAHAAEKVLSLMLARFPEGPEAAEALYRLGTCQFWMGHPEGAEEVFAQVIERWPRSPHAVQARLRLARSAIAQGKYAAAAAVLERFLAETPDAPDRPAALLLLAFARHLAGDGYLALLDYQRLVREAPQSPYAPLARASLARLRGDAIQRAAK